MKVVMLNYGSKSLEIPAKQEMVKIVVVAESVVVFILMMVMMCGDGEIYRGYGIVWWS